MPASHLGLGTPERSSWVPLGLGHSPGQWVRRAGSVLSALDLEVGKGLAEGGSACPGPSCDMAHSPGTPSICPGSCLVLCGGPGCTLPQGGGLEAKALWASGGRLGQGGPLEAGTAGPP